MHAPRRSWGASWAAGWFALGALAALGPWGLSETDPEVRFADQGRIAAVATLAIGTACLLVPKPWFAMAAGASSGILTLIFAVTHLLYLKEQGGALGVSASAWGPVVTATCVVMGLFGIPLVRSSNFVSQEIAENP